MDLCGKKKRIRVTVFVLLFFPFMAVSSAAAETGGNINCDIQNAPCKRNVSGGTVTLDILPRPVKAMEELTFIVKLDNIDVTDTPFIDLGMPGMEMGPNRVEMEQTAPGMFSGKGFIVRCPSGKTVWQAAVNLPGRGQADFIFDVIY